MSPLNLEMALQESNLPSATGKYCNKFSSADSDFFPTSLAMPASALNDHVSPAYKVVQWSLPPAYPSSHNNMIAIGANKWFHYRETLFEGELKFAAISVLLLEAGFPRPQTHAVHLCPCFMAHHTY